MLKFRLILFLIISVGNTFSQKEIVNHTNAWIMYTGNHKVSEKWGLHTEYQWRRSDFFQDWQQSLLRLGVDYYTKQNTQFTVGYGWIRSYQYGKQPIFHNNNEHRIWQQFILKNTIGRIDIQHRYRLEQRFLEQWQMNEVGEFKKDSYVFRQRVRYRFLLTVPLSRKELGDNTLFLSLYDEIFLGFGKGIGKNILDQNRLYGALGWRFNKNVNVQIGYLNQYIIKTNGVQFERNHTIQIGGTYNLDFNK